MRRSFLFAALAALGAVGSARADFAIDDFSAPNPATVNSLGAQVGAQFQATDTLGTGLTRNVTVTQTDNGLGVAGATQVVLGQLPTGGVFSLGTLSQATAFADLAYVPTNGTGLNLSAAGTAVQLHFATDPKTGLTSADQDTPFTVRLVSGTFGTPSFASASQYGSVSSTSTANFSVPISGFGGVDLKNITGIEVLLNTSTPTTPQKSSADFTLTNLSVTTPPDTNSVPAPPAALLGLLAVPALALRRRLV